MKNKQDIPQQNQHKAWAERIQNENSGFNSSLTKGLQLDIIESLKLEKQLQQRIFSNSPINKQNAKTVQYPTQIEQDKNEVSPKVGKDRILEYLAQQQLSKYNSLDRSNDDFNGQAEHLNSKNNQQNRKLQNSQSQLSLLPQLSNKKKHYLAHDLDLTQPDYIDVRVNENKRYNDVYFQNKRDQEKINNKKLEDQQKHIYKQRNEDQASTKISEDSPFNLINQNQVNFNEALMHSQRRQIQMEQNCKNKTKEQNYETKFPIIHSQSQPYIDSETLNKITRLKLDRFKNDQMREVLQPIRKVKQVQSKEKNLTKLEKSIQQELQMRRMVNQEVKKQRKRNAVNRYSMGGSYDQYIK